jgi:hypothetical protein
MLRVGSVCMNEPRSRGAVLSIHAWLRHATQACKGTQFVARTDDDAWLCVPSLLMYLDAVARSTRADETCFTWA